LITNGSNPKIANPIVAEENLLEIVHECCTPAHCVDLEPKLRFYPQPLEILHELA
jgi:hypothetical protein